MTFLGWLTRSKDKETPGRDFPFPFGKEMSVDYAYSYDGGRTVSVQGNGYRGYLWVEGVSPVNPPGFFPPVYCTPHHIPACTPASCAMGWTGGSHCTPLPPLDPPTAAIIPPSSPVIPFPPAAGSPWVGAHSTRSTAAPLPPLTGSPFSRVPDSFGLAVQPPPVTSASIYPEIHSALAADSTIHRQAPLLWDMTHAYTYAHIRGQSTTVLDSMLDQPLMPNNPLAASSKVQIRVEHTSGMSYRKFEVKPRTPGMYLTLRDILEGTQAAFRTPLDREELAELMARSDHAYDTVNRTMMERLHDPSAAGTPHRPIKVDMLNAERFFHGLQIVRQTRSNGWVLKLLVGPQTEA